MKDFAIFDHLDNLDDESKYLIHKAKEATDHSYAPYSKFFVGAALTLDDDTVITGSNQENASYPLCMCAERVALYTFASLHSGKTITKIAIVAHRKNHKELVSATPCGACRQVMAEFEMRQKSNMKVVMMGSDGKWIKSVSATSLLPYNFDLKKE